MRNNNLLLSQHKLINTFSGEAGKTLAGVDREKYLIKNCRKNFKHC